MDQSGNTNALTARFRRVNLTRYAAVHGYRPVPDARGDDCRVMTGPAQDKVVIAISQASGQWIYFTVGNPDDHGTITEFIARRQALLKLGSVGKEMRVWLSPKPPRPRLIHFTPQLKSGDENRLRVMVAFMAMPPVAGRHAYLEQDRAIPAWVLSCPRFAWKIRTDSRGNAVFPHHLRPLYAAQGPAQADRAAMGVCGYQIRGRGVSDFSRGGKKALWVSAANSRDTALIVTDSPVDALSYHALHSPSQARYVSPGEQTLSPLQRTLLQRAIGHLPEAGEVILATGTDEAGDKLSAEITALIRDLERPPRYRKHRPQGRGQDWNDVLRSAACQPVPAPCPV